MPYEDYWDLRQASTIQQIYLLALWRAEFMSVYAEFGDSFDDGTKWIRGSSGRLCIDLERSDIRAPHSSFRHLDFSLAGHVDCNDSTWETKALGAMSISDFHHISIQALSKVHNFWIDPVFRKRITVITSKLHFFRTAA
ncbi:hypothetical protein FB45DRAFT_1024432 [Roridomyces roridus]|uniref:Uncharacterized protein n=1 Tax=Roridomyces roridus TaxID=1738132 RepID=A0AAD7C160_9AGAR|nr:hypothetical protein FB45DRAFT_1024432 [Roridomyces roridus]